MSSVRQIPKISILDKQLSKGKCEINISTFALLFSEIVQYCQNRVLSVPELQTKLSEMGYHVGQRMVDVLFVRERNYKRETKLLGILIFVKTTLWKLRKNSTCFNSVRFHLSYGELSASFALDEETLFGKEADKLEHANDDKKTYYIIEKDPLVNKFISIPKDKGSLNCAAFIAGIIEATLVCCNFPAKVTAHWHKGTTFKIMFDESVVSRDPATDGK